MNANTKASGLVPEMMTQVDKTLTDQGFPTTSPAMISFKNQDTQQEECFKRNPEYPDKEPEWIPCTRPC